MRTKLSGALGLLFLIWAALLAGCNLFGPPPAVPAPLPPPVIDPPVEVRALPAGFSERKAVAYSGFRTMNSTTAPTVEQIDEDLLLLKDAGFGLIRMFGSGGTFASDVLARIDFHDYDIKVQLGIWIDGSKAAKDAANQAEITAGVNLADTYPDIVATVSVGNEKMVDWNVWAPAPAADMIAYIKQVRDQVAQPVTTDDNWAVFANDGGKYPSTAQLLSQVDYVAIHTYPLADTKHDLWNWKQKDAEAEGRAAAMMDAALQKAKDDYQAVRDNLDDQGFQDLPIVIGETGWKSAANDGETSRAHPVNQKMYYDRLADWTDGPVVIMYFEAFDEPWKEGDDLWGLWDIDRHPKYVLKQEDSGYEAADAVYYVPPVPNGTITKNTYLTYADTMTAGATTAVPTEATMWIPWNVPGTATGAETTAAGSDTAGEGSKYMKITPVPAVWGWGFFLNNAATDDLTQFLSAGHLKFSLRTTYAGKLEVGFFTKGTEEVPGNSDVYMSIASGQYGFVNDGAWHEVSIPIADLAPHSTWAYNEPHTAQMNLQLVSSPFTIADRYANTGNSLNASQKVLKIDVDNIRWTRD